MDAWHLSKRLAAVADFVPDGARIADIGSIMLICLQIYY